MYHRRQTVEIVKLFVALSAVKWFFQRCPVGSVHVHFLFDRNWKLQQPFILVVVFYSQHIKVTELKSVARNRFMLLSAEFELEFSWQGPRLPKKGEQKKSTTTCKSWPNKLTLPRDIFDKKRSEGNTVLDSQTIRQACRLYKKDLPGVRIWRHNNWQKVQIPDIEKAQNIYF